MQENPPINAQPEIRASSTTHWNRAAEQRDAFHATIVETLSAEGVNARVTRSVNGIYPVWVKVDAWMPTDHPGGVTDPRIRCSLVFTIDVRPYNEHVLTYSAAANDGKRQIKVSDRPEFLDSHVAQWVKFAIGKAGKPTNYQPVLDAITNLFLAFIPFARGLHSNRISRAYRNWFPFSWPLAFILIGGGLLAGGVSDLTEPPWRQSGAGEAMLLIGAILVGVAIILYMRRRKEISVVDRPHIPPREILLVDSWHAVVPELGARFSEVKSRISARLEKTRSAQISVEEETYGFESPAGYEERERFVVSIGQGVAHVHVYQFGDDVFVGWDSYLNWAQWGETGAVTSRVSAGRITEYRALKEKLYVPNQFDLIDLNSLSEVAHRVITDELKALMKEHKIDQEIDFQIIRGDRDNALDRERFDRNVKDRKQAKPGIGKLANWRVG